MLDKEETTSNIMIKKSFVITSLFIISSLIYTGCGSTQPIVSSGEYYEAGFFLGLFGGLFWPLSLIFIGVGRIFPSFCGDAALYYHWNSGFSYWLGYCIGLLPYLALFGIIKSKRDSPKM